MILTQKSFLTGTTEFELAAESVILRLRKGSQRTQSKVDYAHLIPDPDFRSSSERKYIWMSLLNLLIMFVMMGVRPSVPDDGSRQFITLVFLVFAFLFLVCVYKYFVSRFDTALFFYRNGNFAFRVDRNKPDERAFVSFLEDLGARIKASQDYTPHASGKESLSDEINRLGGLKAKGLLTDDEFSRAKESLLSQLERGSRTMGFQ